VRLGKKSTIDETRAAALLNLSVAPWRHGARARAWMPVPYRYYGAHCVPGTTEVLTRGGWIALEHWTGGDIAQVHTDQTIEFLPAKPYVGPVIDKWIGVRAPYLRCDFTLGHTIPRLMQHHFSWDTIRAGELLDRSFIWTPLAGRLITTGAITPDQMRVLAMVQADGHWELDSAQGRGLFIFLRKPRKIERARYLLRAAGVSFRESASPSHPGYMRFSVAWRDLPAWLTPERKFFGAWLLDSKVEAREALLQEIQHWDGWVQGGQVCYSTSVRANADWLATLAHLTGRCASLNIHHHRGADGYNRAENYRVQLRQRNYGQVSREHSELLNAKSQQAYCATTQTGFFLARCQGRIFVTGNTGRFSGDGGFNFANLRRGSPIRDAITAPEDMRIVHRDSSQIEARMVAWLAGCETLLAAFRECRDVYCEFASLFYRREITKADTLERFVGKTAVLGLGYGMGHEKFRRTLYVGNGGISVRLDEPDAIGLVGTYRETYSEIPVLWRRAERTLDHMLPMPKSPLAFTRLPVIQIEGDQVKLPNGLSIRYPNLRLDLEDDQMYYDAPVKSGVMTPRKIYGPKLIENISQALARIVITDVMVNIYADCGYFPFMSTYDSLDYCVPVSDVAWFNQYLDVQFAVAPDWAKGLPLASEGGWGRTLLAAEKGQNG
jgi:hypothetical protein